MDEKQESAPEQEQKKIPLVVIRGTGRVIRKDGTVEHFTFEDQVSGINLSNGDA